MTPSSPDGLVDPDSIAHHFSVGLHRYRYFILLICVFACILIGSGMYQLRMASNYDVYFDESNPQLQALESLYQTFSRNDNILFVLAPADKKVFSRKTLSVVDQITRAAWQLPFASRVDSVTNFQHISSSNDAVVIAPLVADPTNLDHTEAKLIEAKALKESALVGRLLSPLSDVTGINVRLQIFGESHQAVAMAAEAARKLAADIRQQHPNFKVYLTGNAILNAAFPQAGIYDLTHLTPIMYLMLLISMFILLRSIQACMAAFCVVFFASIIAMGFAGWDLIVLSSASVVAPTIISTVAIADTVHLLTGYLRELKRGRARIESYACTLSANFIPVTLTSLTTSVGFLSLNFSDAPPFRDLGNITAVGVLVAYLLTLFLLPVLLFTLPQSPFKQGDRFRILNIEAYAEWILKVRGMAFWVSLAVVLALSSAIGQVQFNDAFVEYFDQRVAFRRDTDFTQKHLTGIYQIEYAIDSGNPHGVMDPEYLARLDAFEHWLKQQPEVMHVNLITDVLKRLNQHIGNGESALPLTRQLAAQYLLLYEMSIPYGLDLNSRINVDQSISRITVTLRNLDNQRLRGLESRADAWLKANTTPTMHAPAVGPSIMFAYIAEHNIEATLKGAGVAILIISLVLFLVYRNMAIALLCLIPNLVPILSAFGIWALFVGQMGVALVIVITMSLGIVVDDSIHLVTNFVHARRRLGKDAQDSIRYAFQVTGTALIYTSVILVMGFSVLTLSSFQVNHGMGQLTVLVICCALAADFLMLPGLLIFASKRGWV